MIERHQYEKTISKARVGFKDSLSKLESQLDKISKNDHKNVLDLEDYKREQTDLSEYEESFKARINGF